MFSIITKVVEGKIPCIFISPHLDDAILSAGGLISYLSKKTRIDVLTIFTKASPQPYTAFAKQFLSSCGYKDGEKLYLDWTVEDASILKSLRVKVQHLGFIDAAWRKKYATNDVEKIISLFLPEIIHLYPTFRNVFSGILVDEDHVQLKKIIKKIYEASPTLKKAVVFCPLGVGSHVDHIATRIICRKIFPRILYWVDFPYHLNHEIDSSFIKSNNLKKLIWRRNLSKKKDLILGYKTQIKSLFSNGRIPIYQENYYFNPSILETL